MDWLNYIIVIILTALLTTIITERNVVKRIMYKGFVLDNQGKCVMKYA